MNLWTCNAREIQRRPLRVVFVDESTQARSRLKQIDGRSCIGNVNSLKLDGRPARPLRSFATA